MPIVPAWGEGVPVRYRYKHMDRPDNEEAIAPTLLARLVNSPHINGPKKTQSALYW